MGAAGRSHAHIVFMVLAVGPSTRAENQPKPRGAVSESLTGTRS